MKSLNPDVILARLQKMRELLELLPQYETITLAEYQENMTLKLSYERIFQMLADSTLDINRHILSSQNLQFISDRKINRDLCLQMAQCEILDLHLAEQLADAVSMRNILVHLYLNIDDVRVFHSIDQCRRIYPKYIQQVVDYLDRISS